MSNGAAHPAHVAVVDIQRAVAARYGVSVTDLRSARRTANVTLPRLIAVYLARTLTELSLPAIGRLFGNRDHTTILRSVCIVRQRMARDAAFMGEVAALKAQACVHAETAWRSRMPAEVDAFDKALNQFGFELAVVPLGTRDERGFIDNKRS